MAAVTSFQENAEADRLAVSADILAEHSEGGELLGGGATSKVFFAHLSFIKESAMSGYARSVVSVKLKN